MRKYQSLFAFFVIAMQISGCFVGETAAILVQTPFEVVDMVVPGEAGEAVETTGETAAWITDFLIPF
ncbi:hypothetical protein OAL99_01360 [Gammaproteobacteria bacterium]|nr:hypothetical protein [Gammaproteobacteria bacterium]